jgi:hypothetical protein
VVTIRINTVRLRIRQIIVSGQIECMNENRAV